MTKLIEWAARRSGIFVIQLVYLACLGVFVILYRAHWLIDVRQDFFGPVPFLVPWFGAVGAVILSLSGVFEHGKDWDDDDRYWYWSRPFIGGVTSTISVLIFQSGILAVGGQLPEHAKTATAKNLLYYLIAFIAGYRENVFRDLIRRLADVILTPGGKPSAPTISAIEPPQAPGGSQTDVVISGTGFTGTTAVKLGNVSIPFVFDSDTQITATVPATAPRGPTSLLVTNGSTGASVTFTVA
jgi:IPT/TIG domain